MITLKHKYQMQKNNAIIRNIEWQFTFESWLAWWGDDIVNRGRKTGQLVMARNGDIGPYHPDNVRKATCGENCSEGNSGKMISIETRKKISQSSQGKRKTLKNGTSHNAKMIQTPLGIFNSLTLAATAHNCDHSLISYRLKKYPEQYFIRK